MIHRVECSPCFQLSFFMFCRGECSPFLISPKHLGRECFKVCNNLQKKIENKCQCKVDIKETELFGVEPYADLEFSWMKATSVWKCSLENLVKEMNERQSYKVKYNVYLLCFIV